MPLSFLGGLFGGGKDRNNDGDYEDKKRSKGPGPKIVPLAPPLKQGMIKCPYCFNVFSHDDVHFKAMTLKESASWGNADDDFGVEDDDFDPFGDSAEKEDTADTGDKSIDELFEEKEDPQFKNFWSNFANELVWRYANYPVITKDDTRMMRGTYHMDSNGFVDSVTDFYGVETKERICPHCHNPLPPNYGKYQVHFIATVGITSSGKTVYLSQLLKGMNKYMDNVGLVPLDMTPVNKQFIEEHPVKMDVPLPQGTVPGALTPPLFYVLIKGGVYHTLVFYDVAGESCVEVDELNKYGGFIRNADGIIMILDPHQFSLINTSDDNVIHPTAVIQAMFNAFLGGKGQGQQLGIPLALALSKSDTLEDEELISPNSNIFRDLVYDSRRKGFDVQQYRNLMGEVRKFLNGMTEGSLTINAINEFFANTGLFAFSALNCGVKVEERMIDGEMKKVAMPVAHPNPRRIEEPLLWMLSEFGIIPKIGQPQR